MNPTIKIVMIEDHQLVMQSLIQTIALSGRPYEVVGTATSAKDGLRQTTLKHPDVVLLDIDLPDQSGTSIVEKLKNCPSSPKILAVTHHTDPLIVRQALSAGVDGYLVKASGDLMEFITAIDKVIQGECYFSQEILPAVREGYTLSEKDQAVTAEDLTAIELNFIRYIAEGRRYQDIARTMNKSVSWVEKYMHRLCQKTKCDNPYQLAAWGGKNGLV